MNLSDFVNLLSESEYLVYRAADSKARRHSYMSRARVHKANGLKGMVSMSVETARDANHEYVRNAVKLRTEKELAAQRRQDYRKTLRQY